MTTIVPALILFVVQLTIEVALAGLVQQEFVLGPVQRIVVRQATHITQQQHLPAVRQDVTEQEPEQIIIRVQHIVLPGVVEDLLPHILHPLHPEYKPVSKRNDYLLK